MSVLVVMRKPSLGQFSVERVFRDLAAGMPRGIDAQLVEVPYPSKGIWPRVKNVMFTARLRADVIHIAGDIQYCALAVRGRCLLTILDLVSLRRLRGWRRRVLGLVWYRLPVRRAQGVAVISGSVREELVELLPIAASKTRVLGCPVSREFAPSVPQSRTAGAPVVLAFGNTPNKNLDRIAAALPGLDVHLHVVGRLTRDQLRSLQHAGLSCSWTAAVPESEILSIYQRSDLLLFPSTYEGFGLPILEAQACGIPVVTSGLPPMSEVAGGAAILVDPYSIASIRNGVELLLGDLSLQGELVAAGLRNAAKYSPERVAAGYAQAYRELVSNDER